MKSGAGKAVLFLCRYMKFNSFLYASHSIWITCSTGYMHKKLVKISAVKAIPGPPA